jgi:hypothetical protein
MNADNRSRPEGDFPVTPRPPRSHYFPRHDQQKRKRDLRVRLIARRIIENAAHLDDAKYRPLILSLARITLLIERSYAAIADGELISSETGELRTSLSTISGLIAQQTRMLIALGLAPAVIGKIAREKPVDLAAMFANAEKVESDGKPG